MPKPKNWDEVGTLLTSLPAKDVQDALQVTAPWAYRLKKAGFKHHITKLKEISRLLKAAGLGLTIIETKKEEPPGSPQS